MKNLSFLLLLCLFVVSCNSTKSSIITSKSEAIKKNKYDASLAKSVNKKVRPNLESNTKTEAKKSSQKINTSNDNDLYSDETNYLIEQLILAAEDNIGVPYKMGGTSKSGFDCSGFMLTTFNKFDISLPRTSTEMSQTGKAIDKNNARKGDLIFFVTNGRSISHVGMIIEVNDDEIKFIHASTSSGVMVSSLNESYYKNNFAKIKRVID